MVLSTQLSQEFFNYYATRYSAAHKAKGDLFFFFFLFLGGGGEGGQGRVGGGKGERGAISVCKARMINEPRSSQLFIHSRNRKGGNPAFTPSECILIRYLSGRWRM